MSEQEPRLEWKVFRHDSNGGKIITWNIFEHGRFYSDVLDLLEQETDRDGFAVELQRTLRYYFWAKSEYEVIIKEWVGTEAERKVDISQQVILNFEPFVDYVWSFRTPQKKN